MDYEFWFWVGVAFISGRISHHTLFYIGSDEQKYKEAYFAILIGR